LAHRTEIDATGGALEGYDWTFYAGGARLEVTLFSPGHGATAIVPDGATVDINYQVSYDGCDG
jgi:hypothetical protein